MLEAKTDNSSNESLFLDKKPEANNGDNPAHDRKEVGTRQTCADVLQLRPSKEDSQPSMLRDSYVKPLSTFQVMVAHASLASSKPKVELDSYADTWVVGDNY